ncbi:hypothetical protein FOXYS1_13606 [Fusarium oxysporum]|uniref:Integral membrane protein n=1 Tax=Fusarium oxysporum TaxID=5507 RepID=A0A8H5A1V9_FUSOX|nr:hypothetical protein FOXYS1_13606 [Fusarium oxysporum]
MQFPTSQSSAYPPRPVTPPTHPCGVTPTTTCVETPSKFASTWFTHDAAPRAFICSRCFVDHIYETPFRGSFKHCYYNDGVPRKCMLGAIHKMKNIEWPAAVRHRSLDQVLAFWRIRQDIPHCSGAAAQKNTLWYTSDNLANLKFCRACYQDNLSFSALGARFQPRHLSAETTCSSAILYVKRMVDTHAVSGDWPTFIREVKARLDFPACNGLQQVSAKERAFFTPKRHFANLNVCLGCFCDYFHDTPNQDMFAQRTPDSAQLTCAMGHLNILLPTLESLEKRNWGPKCARWYTLRSNPEGFAVCGACVAGIIEPLGGAKFFISRTSPWHGICCFNRAYPRAVELLQHFTDSLYTGQQKDLDDYTFKFAHVPKCPRNDLDAGKGIRYWGWDYVHICEECYLQFARGTTLEARFELHGTRTDKARMCDLYSPRMRHLFNQACTSGDLNSFLALGQHRRVVYLETVPTVRQLLIQQRVSMNQSMMYGNMGSVYKSIGGAIDATQGHAYTGEQHMKIR